MPLVAKRLFGIGAVFMGLAGFHAGKRFTNPALLAIFVSCTGFAADAVAQNIASLATRTVAGSGICFGILKAGIFLNDG